MDQGVEPFLRINSPGCRILHHGGEQTDLYNKILSNWHKNGITTVKEAKADHEQHVQDRQGMSSGSAMRKQVDFGQFEQHSYTDEDLEHLFEDLENA